MSIIGDIWEERYLPVVEELQALRAAAAAVVIAMKAGAISNPTLTALEALLPPVSTLAIRFES